VAQLIVRNVDADLVRRLKRRAAEHGRSAEEVHPRLLRAALRSDGLLDRLMQMPDAGADDFDRAADMPRERVIGYLLDAIVVSELRKRERGDADVRRWFDSHANDEFWPSVLGVCRGRVIERTGLACVNPFAARRPNEFEPATSRRSVMEREPAGGGATHRWSGGLSAAVEPF
jgi:plasmid stability protein